MNKIVLLLAAILVPSFSQADEPPPTETNLCVTAATGIDSTTQKYITDLCNSGLAMQGAIGKYQQNPAQGAQGGGGGGVGAAGGLGGFFGGNAKPVAPAAPVSSGSTSGSIYK